MPEPLSRQEFHRELELRGVTQLKRVSFRNSGRTLWTLTQSGAVLNVHSGYAAATPEVLDAFATILSLGFDNPASAEARSIVKNFAPMREALAASRRERAHREAERNSLGVRASRALRRSGPPTPKRSCATPEQEAFLVSLYQHYNRTRFRNELPLFLPIRLSNRMEIGLGACDVWGRRTAGVIGDRVVVAITLNVDLMLEGNEAALEDTLLHEMAHAAAFLVDGHIGHGQPWRTWARRVGCSDQRCAQADEMEGRKHGTKPTTRIPPLPEGATQCKVPDLVSLVDPRKRVRAGTPAPEIASPPARVDPPPIVATPDPQPLRPPRKIDQYSLF